MLVKLDCLRLELKVVVVDRDYCYFHYEINDIIQGRPFAMMYMQFELVVMTMKDDNHHHSSIEHDFHYHLNDIIQEHLSLPVNRHF